MSSLMPVSCRSGVTSRVRKSETRAVLPVTCWMNLTWSPSTRSPSKARAIHPSGERAARYSAGFTTRVIHAARVTASVVRPEIHPGVERGDLLGVAVEHQGLSLEELPDAPLPRLAPAWVV